MFSSFRTHNLWHQSHTQPHIHHDSLDTLNSCLTTPTSTSSAQNFQVQRSLCPVILRLSQHMLKPSQCTRPYNITHRINTVKCAFTIVFMVPCLQVSDKVGENNLAAERISGRKILFQTCPIGKCFCCWLLNWLLDSRESVFQHIDSEDCCPGGISQRRPAFLDLTRKFCWYFEVTILAAGSLQWRTIKEIEDKLLQIIHSLL